MSTTAQQLIESAYGRSTANDPGKLAVDAELITHLNRKYQSVFAMMAIAGGDNILNKTSLVLSGTPASVILPTDIIDITRLEDASGVKVHIIPAEQKDRTWHLPPAVFRQGLSIVSLGRAGDPVSGGVLVVYYLDAPLALTTLASQLDPRYPVRFENLLVLDLAVYLSLKDEDRNPEEYKALKAELTGEEGKLVQITGGGQTAGHH